MEWQWTLDCKCCQGFSGEAASAHFGTPPAAFGCGGVSGTLCVGCVLGSGSDSGLLCTVHSAWWLKPKPISWERHLLTGAKDQEDLPVAVLPQPPKRRSGKRLATSTLPCGRAPVLCDGPRVLGAIIGERGGRWSPSHCKVEPMLQRSWQSRGVLTTVPSLESPLVFGFAVVRAWQPHHYFG